LGAGGRKRKVVLCSRLPKSQNSKHAELFLKIVCDEMEIDYPENRSDKKL
jgi:hypothetical protein